MATTTTCSWGKSSVTASSFSSSTPVWRRSAGPLSGPAVNPTPVPGPSGHSRQSSYSSESWHTASRSPSPSSSSSSLSCYMASHGDLTLGRVLHLPASPPDQNSVIFEQLLHGSRPFGHPVVITGKSVEGGVEYVTMRICTTFGGRHIVNAKETRFHGQYVLVENDEDNITHEGSVLAAVEPGSGRFKSRTYIGLMTEYKIEYKHLAPWATTSPVTIDQVSTQRLVRGCPAFQWSSWTRS
ncbi:hypothetical protein J1614_004016 [Plenodomus biglobosus]|nr:hypothetical protein J1614_004016 [Plenodomus biglobosus]